VNIARLAPHNVKSVQLASLALHLVHFPSLAQWEATPEKAVPHVQLVQMEMIARVYLQ